MNKNFDFDFYAERWDIWFQGNQQDEHTLRHNKVKFSRAIKLSSRKTRDVYREWGNAYADLEDHPKRLVKLKRALAIKPDSDRILQEVANSLNCLKRHEEALAYYKKVLEFAPDRISPHRELLQTLKLMEKLKDFESHYQEFLDLHPDEKTNSEFYYAKAEALVVYNEYPAALESYKTAIEIAPDDPGSHFQYGMALYHEACYVEALKEFEKVVVLEPTNKHAYNNVAFLNYHLGNIHEAIGGLEYIIENNLEIYATYSNMILLKYHLSQNEDVVPPYIQQLKRFIETDYDILVQIYNEDLRLTELKLKEDLDEQTKDFQQRKLNGIKLVLSLIG